jgi:hypothetical protein
VAGATNARCDFAIDFRPFSLDLSHKTEGKKANKYRAKCPANVRLIVGYATPLTDLLAQRLAP